MNLFDKSVSVIKESQTDKGGLLATPPNGAYPYVYIRDGVIMSKALNAVGDFKRSEKFYYFLRDHVKVEQYNEIFHRYDMSGLPSATQVEENDNPGLLLHGIYDTYLASRREIFIDNLWPLIESISKLIFSLSKSGLVKTKRSIHESLEWEKGYELWSNCASWRGLKDATDMAEILGHEKEKKLWEKKTWALEKNINQRLFNSKKGFYMKKVGFPNTPDISQLAPFYFGLSNSEESLKKTMDFVKKHLWNKEIGGFRRFRKFENVRNWHWYTGGSGSWAAFTAWGARFYRELGDKENMRMCLNWLRKTALRTDGLLPEHISTRPEYNEWKAHETEFNQRIIQGMKIAEKFAKKSSGKNNIIYWATPLGWSHAEYILLNKNRK